jgi:hypothetical protein
VSVLSPLIIGAASVAALHTLAPDHWMPFTALARANRWSTAQLLRTTILCGFGHVTLSALLALSASLIGLEVIQRVGTRLQEQATWLLIVFGCAYLIWGLWRSFGRHHHRHWHHGVTTTSLLIIFSSDICVALIPLVFAATVNGLLAVVAVIVVYEVATIGSMVLLVLASHHGVRRIEIAWMDRYGDAVAGGVIVFVGGAMVLLGI